MIEISNLVIGRNQKNLFAAKENLFELVSKNVGEQTEFEIIPYLSVVRLLY